MAKPTYSVFARELGHYIADARAYLQNDPFALRTPPFGWINPLFLDDNMGLLLGATEDEMFGLIRELGYIPHPTLPILPFQMNISTTADRETSSVFVRTHWILPGRASSLQTFHGGSPQRQDFFVKAEDTLHRLLRWGQARDGIHVGHMSASTLVLLNPYNEGDTPHALNWAKAQRVGNAGLEKYAADEFLFEFDAGQEGKCALWYEEMLTLLDCVVRLGCPANFFQSNNSYAIAHQGLTWTKGVRVKTLCQRE